MEGVTESPPDLIPARMLNEYAYCPRLCWLEWVEAEFADSVDTVDGRFQHRRVDREEGALADPDSARAGERAGQEEGGQQAVDDPVVSRARSVMMSDADLGLIARMDLVEDAGGSAVAQSDGRSTPSSLPRRAAPPWSSVPRGEHARR